jgi:hypothetical protein
LGSGAATTIIDGGGRTTVVFISHSSADVTLSRLTIRNGAACGGGGIANVGRLTIDNSSISSNVAFAKCRFTASGGGIYNVGLGTLVIANSTISGNHANGYPLAAEGGGIYNQSGATGVALAINNSTIGGNTATGRNAEGWGGGIYNERGMMMINNSTVGNNSGGGIYNKAALTIQNSIVANSSSGGNCSGTMTSKGYNLSGDGSCNFNGPGDMNNTDPLLGPLQNNGGPTQTMALPSVSPAIDAGNPSGCTDGQGHLLRTDQRGMPRPDGEDKTGCDIGAYESQNTGHHGPGYCAVVGGSLTGECLGLRGEICMEAYDPVHCPPGQRPPSQTQFCRRPVDAIRECTP